MEQSPKVTHTVMPLCVQSATIHVKARVVKRAWLADQWGGFSRWFLLVYISFMTLSQRYHKHRICFFRESQKETKVSPEIHGVIFSPIPLYPSSSYTPPPSPNCPPLLQLFLLLWARHTSPPSQEGITREAITETY